MKMYICFAGLNYYPSGGMEDYVYQSMHIDAIKKFVEDSNDYHWAQIVDWETKEIIWKGYENSNGKWTWEEFPSTYEE